MKIIVGAALSARWVCLVLEGCAIRSCLHNHFFDLFFSREESVDKMMINPSFVLHFTQVCNSKTSKSGRGMNGRISQRTFFRNCCEMSTWRENVIQTYRFGTLHAWSAFEQTEKESDSVCVTSPKLLWNITFEFFIYLCLLCHQSVLCLFLRLVDVSHVVHSCN